LFAMPRPPLNPGVSLYLDLTRICAALMVCLHHLLQPPFFDRTIAIPGRSAVIVFFVISGFVIAYSSVGERDWRAYAVSRLGRVYSVAIPALLLTGMVALAEALLWPNVVAERQDWPGLRLLLSVFFVNQFWNLTIGVLSNGPYWSLCYEVWYYVLFGIVWFCSGWRRLIAAAMVVLLVGPRILLLMPIWLLGAGLYLALRRRGAEAAPRDREVFFVVVSLFVFVLLVYNPASIVTNHVEQSLHNGYWHVGSWRVFIGGDAHFAADYLLGLLFAVTVWFSGGVFDHKAVERLHGRVIRWCSSYTFSLYLYHAPLMVFFHSLLMVALPDESPVLVLLVLIMLGVWALGSVTEHRKEPYTALFRRLLSAGVPPRA